MPKLDGKDIDNVIYDDVRLTPGTTPQLILHGKSVDIWQEPYLAHHSKSPREYIKEKIMEFEKNGEDAFPDIVGKAREKELVKDALFSNSSILLRGERGYGKTTLAKAIGKLLPDRILTIKGCKIYDDPVKPVCFPCKAKVRFNERVELLWVPRIWVRIPGDPMMTTRQLIGGISIQKIREGFDLDHPEVFIPGRALKSNRGVGYFDELGSIPTSLQTLLHELFEEGQVTTTEGDILPFKVSTIELASTNPANYRGTSPIKEPLLDRMESIEIGPPDTLEEEIQIGKMNTYYTKSGIDPKIPDWHCRILTRIVRFARDQNESEVARKVRVSPSCRATIKLLDHVKSKAIRSGRQVPILEDYGPDYEILSLALDGRMELEYGVKESKREVIKDLVEESIRKTGKEIYDLIPEEGFDEFYAELRSLGTSKDGEIFVRLDVPSMEKIKSNPIVRAVISSITPNASDVDDEVLLSAMDIVLHSIFVCNPILVNKSDGGYLMKEMSEYEERV